MEDYKSNSHKSRENSEEKNIEKIVTGTAKAKKKNEVQKFADVFISEDIANVKSYVLMDVLVPAVKKAISDIVVNGIDMILYGETGHSKKTGGNKPSYRSYYDNGGNNRSVTTAKARTSYSFDDLILDNRGDAEGVLERMREIIDTYGTVSVGDMYDLAGITGTPFTNNKYGWTDLRTAYVDRVKDGYLIKLPRVLPL